MLETIKVLCLDDEPLITADLAEHLRGLGVGHVAEAFALQEATDLANAVHFDVALLDVNLGRGEQSFALAAALRAKGTRIAFLTGSVDDHAAIAQLGDHMIGKPFTLAQITASLTTLVQKVDPDMRHPTSGSSDQR